MLCATAVVRGFLLVLLNSLLLAACASTPQKVSDDGVWELIAEDRCTETLTFIEDGMYTLDSGQQHSLNSYKIEGLVDSEFYRFTKWTVYYNGEPSCSGKIDTASGEKITAYIKYNQDKSEIHLYAAPNDGDYLNMYFRKKR